VSFRLWGESCCIPSLPARANQEAGFVPTPRYGRGSDLELILEVIGSADRIPLKDFVCSLLDPQPKVERFPQVKNK